VASRSEREARALLLLLADRRLYDPTALQLMLSETPPVRRDLARTLGRLGDPRGRSLLQGLLVDSDLEVRREAAFALGELGNAEARRALVVAAVDPDRELGGLAVEALGKLGTPLAEVRRPLSALGEEESLRRLAPFLFRFREAEAVEVAARGLASTEAAVRRGAAYALGREPRPEGVELLRGALDDEDPFVRAWAARGLGRVGDLGDLERLEARLGDPESSPRVQALRAGAEILSRSPALPPLGWGDRIVALLDDERPGVRAAALEAAAVFLPHPALEAAVESRLATGEPRERELALLALAAADVEAAAGAVAVAASAPDPRTRAVAAEAAARRGDVDTLFRLTEDSDASVRRAALEGLGRGAGDATAELAERFLRDPDPTVRATALEMLAEQPGVAARLLAETLDRAREDPMNDARLAGVRALAARGRREPGEAPAVLEALERLAGDPDWLVRREAAAGLEALGGQRPEVGPVETGRSLAIYRDVFDRTRAERTVEIETERGVLRLALACPEAPQTCLSFLQLAGQGFFDGIAFHRVVPDFVVQGGDPRGDGWGGPGYSLRDEINRLRFERGALGMALSGPDTGGSQFFLTLSPQPHLDGGFTVFGRLVDGFEVLDRIRQGDRVLAVREVEGGGGSLR